MPKEEFLPGRKVLGLSIRSGDVINHIYTKLGLTGIKEQLRKLIEKELIRRKKTGKEEGRLAKHFSTNKHFVLKKFAQQSGDKHRNLQSVLRSRRIFGMEAL